MTQISASDVGKLRRQTGSGMMDCKKALIEANGDFDQAVDILRKKGQKVAAKRADRQATEGVVIAKNNEENNKAVLISLNCETDFVAKNEDFINIAKHILDKAVSENLGSSEDLNTLVLEDGMSVAEKVLEQTGVIGEKIEIGDFKILKAPFVGSYIHAGNKIATLVGLSAKIDNAAEVAKNVAMQAAAMNPIALNEDGVDASIIEKEIEIAKDQLRQEGKPEEMLDNIAKGKIKRFFKDNTLVNQDFIKDSKVSVGNYVKSAGDAEITGFARISLV